MRFIRKITAFFICVVSASVFLYVGYAGYLYFSNGRILSGHGDIRVYNAEKDDWEPYRKGYKLDTGDIIRTGAGSSCTVLLGGKGQAVMTAGEKSQVKLNAKDRIELEMEYGEVIASLSRPGRKATFRIKTPLGTCGARGTGWKVTADKGSGAAIEVFNGKVKYGSTYELYEEDPYIIPSGEKLLLTGGAAGQSTEYVDIASDRYDEWNGWVGATSGTLDASAIINDIAYSEPDPYPEWQEGVCYASWQPLKYSAEESDIAITKIERDINATWINLVTTWYQPVARSTLIRPLPEKTPADEALIHVIRRAHRLGMKIMLTPQLDLEDTEGGLWRGDISFSTSAEWDKWFEGYRAFILHYAVIAEAEHVKMFNIGTELALTTTQRPDKWIELIKEVRGTYKGRLVYTANWHEEYKEIKFWKYLDYAGIAAYFPLSDKDRPSYIEILKNWGPWLKDIEQWQATHGQPVIFPEIGYKSCEGTVREPWAHQPTGPVDIAQQERGYRAALQTFWNKKWFYGMYWWTWRTHPLMGGPNDRGFTPNDKPAAEVLSSWYTKPDPHKAKPWLTRVKNITEALK
ncbi:MAG: FecR domain-containing protein [Candidatus Omnitrophica bacterium]|nr:FecR domain-containing protein [Candidatus Omnitrophota bacterium]